MDGGDVARMPVLGGHRPGRRGEEVRFLVDLLARRGHVAPDADHRGDLVPVRVSRSRWFLVPVHSRRAAGRSLVAYSSLRPPLTRAARLVLAGALRAGLAQRLLRTRIAIPRPAPGEDPAETVLTAHLAGVLGERGLTFATGLRRAGAHYTPVLQLFTREGVPVGYAKLGWDEVTRRHVRREADVLERLARSPRLHVHAPAPLYRGTWHDLEVSVTAPLPPRARRVPRHGLPYVRAAREVAGLDGPVTVASLAGSPYWETTVTDAARIDTARGSDEYRRAIEHLERAFGDVALAFGRWHGDWVAWNMAVADGRLYVWDWEYSEPGVPLGFDVLHCYFQQRFVVNGRPAVVAFRYAAEAARAALQQVGLDTAASAAVTALHRLEVRLRAERAALLGAERDVSLCDVPLDSLLAA